MSVILAIALAYCLGLLIYAGVLTRQLQPVTLRNIRTFSAGPSGLVKTFYIQSANGYHMYKHSDTSRKYVGLTLSKLLYPGRAINKAGVVTFYALYSSDKKSITHFAAVAGTKPASVFRLYLDACGYLMQTFYFVYFAIFLTILLLKDIYQKLKEKVDIEAEVTSAYNESTLGKWHSKILLILFIFLIL